MLIREINKVPNHNFYYNLNGYWANNIIPNAGGEAKIEVRLANETVWLTADQMAVLFQRNKSTISRHIKNIYESGELEQNRTVAFLQLFRMKGSERLSATSHTTIST